MKKKRGEKMDEDKFNNNRDMLDASTPNKFVSSENNSNTPDLIAVDIEQQEKLSALQNKTPQEIEAELIQKMREDSEKEIKPADIEESASLLFGLYIGKFANLVNKLSSKSLRRLIYSLVAVPLEEAKLNLKNEDERTAYQIAEQLLVSKSALIMSTYATEERNRQAVIEQNKQKEGENNGQVQS
jgi:hypothetical protein